MDLGMTDGRSPHGERGLKLDRHRLHSVGNVSLSSRRAWIEIGYPIGIEWNDTSLSSRRAWIEINVNAAWRDLLKSLSSRRAWIEI